MPGRAPTDSDHRLPLRVRNFAAVIVSTWVQMRLAGRKGHVVGERVLQSVTWRQQHATQIELDFGDGQAEVVSGTHADAARMAEEAGLRLVASPLGSVRWTRAPSTGGDRVPKRIGPWLST